MIQPYKVTWEVLPVKGNYVGHDDYEVRAYAEYAGVTYGSAGRVGNVVIWTLMRSDLTRKARARMFRALVRDNVERMTQDIWDRIYHEHKEEFMEEVTLAGVIDGYGTYVSDQVSYSRRKRLCRTL